MRTIDHSTIITITHPTHGTAEVRVTGECAWNEQGSWPICLFSHAELLESAADVTLEFPLRSAARDVAVAAISASFASLPAAERRATGPTIRSVIEAEDARLAQRRRARRSA